MTVRWFTLVLLLSPAVDLCAAAEPATRDRYVADEGRV
jgi:hypothetical protein